MFEQTHKHAKELGKKGLPYEDLYAQIFQRDLANRSITYNSRFVSRPTYRRLRPGLSRTSKELSFEGDDMSDFMEGLTRPTSRGRTRLSINNRLKSIGKSR